MSFLANNRFHTKEYIDSIIIAIQINRRTKGNDAGKCRARRRTKAYWRMSRTTTQLCAYRGVELVWIFVWFAIGQTQECEEITRFLFKPDKNYKLTYAAAGISSKKVVDTVIELDAKDSCLEIRNGEMIFFIHGKKLMELTHKIYERCKK